MYHPFHHFKPDQNVAEDVHSTETTSTSGSKSSTFSAQNPHLFSHSSCYTTPSHSRSSSQDFDQQQKMDVEPNADNIITRRPSPAGHSPNKQNLNQQNQHIPLPYAVNHHTISHAPSVSAAVPMLRLGEDDTAMDDQDDLTPTPGKSPSSGYSPDPSIIIGVGSGLTDSLFPDTPSSAEILGSPEASLADEDLDLEKSADEALSRWFGISLHRLVAPFRVIYAFEQVKRECAGILQDEGHYQPDDDEDSQESQADPYDAGESNRSTPNGRPWTNKTSASPFGDKRRLSNRVSKSGSSPDSYVKVRGKNKKHRSERELSCPYRKRNPNRFNVRDHEQCANRSYQTMSDVKRHLQSHHLRLICTRCRCPFERASDLLAHSQRCIAPPQSHTNVPPTDPEDGFDQTMDDRLRSRGNSLKIDEWNDLYRALFPNDDIIPVPYFVPVVEDHDVLLRYKCSQQGLYRDIQELVARQPLDSTASGDRLREDAVGLVQKLISTILECSKSIEQDPPTQETHVDPVMQLSESLEDDFIDLTEERDHTSAHLFGSDRSNGTFSTPQYMLPDNNQGILTQDGAERCLDNSQNMGFLPVYSAPEEVAEAYPYAGESTTYYNPTNVATRPSFWASIPTCIRHTISLPGDLQGSTASSSSNNINGNQVFPWAQNDNFPVDQNNYNEACPDSSFYFDDKGQFSTMPTNPM